jgi:tetratricopeptide (TPR) repeat protein
MYLSAQRLFELGNTEQAATYMEKAVATMISVYDSDPNASYENIVTIGDIVHDRYNDAERAERIYRQGISFDAQKPDAYYGLAATLQAQGDDRGALALVEEYINKYGEAEQMVQAREILQNALGESATP